MARTVVAVFESVYLAKKAVLELLDLGYTREKIDLRAEERIHEITYPPAKAEPVRSEMVMDELQAGGSIGAGIGGWLGIIGGLLVVTGELNLPILAAIANGSVSTLAEFAALTGAGLVGGGIVGSLISGLVGLGIPENEVQQYAKTARHSKVTVMVMSDWDVVDETIQVLEHYNPLEIQQKSIEWHKAGPKEKKMAEQGLNVKIRENDRPQ